MMRYVLFYKQESAYERRISDWSSDVCSSDLHDEIQPRGLVIHAIHQLHQPSIPIRREAAGVDRPEGERLGTHLNAFQVLQCIVKAGLWTFTDAQYIQFFDRNRRLHNALLDTRR